MRTCLRLKFAAAVMALGALLVSVPATAQTAIPTEIRKIIDKVKGGQEPTDDESAKLEAWLDAQAEARKPGGANKAFAPDVCPSAPAPTLTLPGSAPGVAEYMEVLRKLSTASSLKASVVRPDIDRALVRADRSDGASEIGALLHMAGDEDASVYASATAALRNPGSSLLANNLGVALTAVGNYPDATRVLLFASRLQPNAALVELNLGWTYFQAAQLNAAEAQFKKALSLNAKMVGAEGGLGVIAACRGDYAGAARSLKAVLDKRYSAVFAGIYKQTKGRMTTDQLPPPQPDNKAPSDSRLVPELPVSPDRGRTLGAKASLERLGEETDERLTDLRRKLLRLRALVAELNARDSRDPGSAMVFRRVFDKELLQYSETLELTFGQRIAALTPTVTATTAVSQKIGAEMMARIVNAEAKAAPLRRDMARASADFAACSSRFKSAFDPGLEACTTAYNATVKKIEAAIDEIYRPLCEPLRQMAEALYTQQYKRWKPYSDAVRIGADDLYAFTDPILASVYAPALNEYLAAHREASVLAAYKNVVGLAGALAASASGTGLKCDPPPPPEPAATAGPALPAGKEANCPFGPQKLDLKIVSIEFDCEKFAISGGEGIMAKVEYNGSKNETTIWVGAGVSAGVTVGEVSARDSDTGADSNALAPALAPFGKLAPSVQLEGKAGFSFTFRGQSLQDVGFNVEASGSISGGGASLSGTINSGVAVEGGLKFGGESGYQLAGAGPIKFEDLPY